MGRICRTPNSCGREASRDSRTANSISAGRFMPRAPTSSSSDRASASGNTWCLSTGANVTRRTPERDRPSEIALFSGTYVLPRAFSVPSRSATSRPNRVSRIAASGGTLASREFSSSAQNSRCELASVSSTEENCGMCCG